ncbi:retrovirus-related pol polyprotein from transposon TNT 1-94 [Tanacetum coccineum]
MLMAVCATCGKCVFNLNHFACLSKFTNDVNARTKKLRRLYKSTLFIVDLEHQAYDGKMYLAVHFVENYLGYRSISTCLVRDLLGKRLTSASPTQAWLWHQRLSHLNFDYINLLLKKDIVIGLPKLEDETPEVLKDFLTMIQQNLQAPVISVGTDRGTEF